MVPVDLPEHVSTEYNLFFGLSVLLSLTRLSSYLSSSSSDSPHTPALPWTEDPALLEEVRRRERLLLDEDDEPDVGENEGTGPDYVDQGDQDVPSFEKDLDPYLCTPRSRPLPPHPLHS